MPIQKIVSGRVLTVTANEFVGENGLMFYQEGDGNLRISDGQTPGGLPAITSVGVLTSLDVAGDTDLQGNLAVRGNITVGGSIIVGDQPLDTITIQADFTSDLIPNSDNTYKIGSSESRWKTVYANSIDVGNTLINGIVDVTGNTSIVGKVKLTGDTSISGMVAVTGDTSILGNTAVTGITSLFGDTSVLGKVAVTGDTSVLGKVNVTGNTSVTGDTSVLGNVAVTGIAALTGNVLVTGLVTVNGNITADSAFTNTPLKQDDSNTVATTAYVKSQLYLTDVEITGDATGTDNRAIKPPGHSVVDITLIDTGIVPGIYTKLTVDSKGRSTFGDTLVDADIPIVTSTKISDFDDQVRTSRLDQMASPISSVSLNNQKITHLSIPIEIADAVTKEYSDYVDGGNF